MFWAVVGVPKFCCHEEFFPCQYLLLDRLFDSVSNFDLVGIITGTVQQPVASFYGIVDSTSADLIRDLPSSVSAHWHQISRIKNQLTSISGFLFSFQQTGINLSISPNEWFSGMLGHLIIDKNKIRYLPRDCGSIFISKIGDVFKNVGWEVRKITKFQTFIWWIFIINPTLEHSYHLITEGIFTRFSHPNSRQFLTDQSTIIVSIVEPLKFIIISFHFLFSLGFIFCFEDILPPSSNGTFWVIFFSNYSYIPNTKFLKLFKKIWMFILDKFV